ncbi:hypothetical protein CC86DRAFT_467039 [Ophiobolus disseminans]|uniref:Uncharacterized protein n=1 Tax=Ophiobolus disseminans TaxID=1469910 RepID=A0A6A7A0Q4_9PLEO|nr:hypothetical protein CC86DRAFT_467039 [Ophiobolus disseminans]
MYDPTQPPKRHPLHPKILGYNYLHLVRFASGTNSPSPSPPPAPKKLPQNLVPYAISTKEHTATKDFERMVRKLDGGAGEMRKTALRYVYRTNLDPAQVEGIREWYPFVWLCYANVYVPGEEGEE